MEVRNMRRAGWFWIDNDLLDVFAPIIGTTAIAVYNMLARISNNETQTAWPAIETVAKRLGISIATVNTALKKLAKAGLISIEPRFTATGTQTSNIYSLLEMPSSFPKNTSPPHKNLGGAPPKNTQEILPAPIKNGEAPPKKVRGELDSFNYTHNITIGTEIPVELSADADANFASQKSVAKTKPKVNGKAQAKVEKPKALETPGLHRQLVSKLIEVCGWNGSALLPSNYSLLGKVAKNLAAIGVMPEDLAIFLAWWWQEDFRGKAGQRPTPPLIESVWPLFSAKRQIVKPTQPKTVRIIDPLTGNIIEIDSVTGKGIEERSGP